MGKYVYEKLKAGSKFYLLSQHDGDSWAGPAIKHSTNDNVTSLGIYTDNQKFSFEVDIHKPEGNEYVIRMNNKEGNTNGPVIVLADNSLYFGPYYAKYGFHGIVYKLRIGENIVIQQYKYGVLVDACIDKNVIYENVAFNLPFDAWFEVDSDDVVERKLDNKRVKGIEVVAGDPTGHLTTLAALVKSDGDIIVGQYSNNYFTGLGLEYNSQNCLYTLQFYEDGVPQKDYRLVYSPQAGAYALILKNTQLKDEKIKYISLFYAKAEKNCRFEIQHLSAKEEMIGNSIVLPDYIDPNAPKAFGQNASKRLSARDEEGFTAQERLNNLIGLDDVKKEIDLLKALYNKNPNGKMTLNMCFYGNPGTGKTEVARLLSEILYEEGILSEKKLVEVDASGLIAEYVGQTQPKTHKVIQSALNGVLFIDEAYVLASGGYKSAEGGDFGGEAIAALLEDMEKYRGQICIILAGYRKEMEDMIASNPGFSSRINRKIDFKDYTKEELEKITELCINKLSYSAEKDVVLAIAKIVDSQRFMDNFANARDIRNVVEKLTEYQALRTINEKSNKIITMADVNSYLEKKPNEIDGLTAEERLNKLIGLDNVKNEIAKMFALLEKQKGDLGSTNLHMCFYGNPGTGKTEVANLIADIFYDKGILPTNKVILTNPSGLISEYAGNTQPKTHNVVKSALNGVLFIDEAYVLAESNYGKEAIAALLEDMETYRGKFCVILAGYKDEIEYMISINPGFDSRINRKIDFPDYTINELLQIAQLMLDNKEYSIEDDAKTEVGKILLYMKESAKKGKKTFANARDVRNLLESLYEIQALRTAGNTADYLIKLEDVKEYEDDHSINLNKEKPQKHNFSIDTNEIIKASKDYTPTISADYIQQSTVIIKVEGEAVNGEGTGFFITKNGIIATCAHVVKNADKITVIVNYKIDKGNYITKDYAAEVIAINEYDDVAIIGILSQNVNVSFYPLKSEKLGYPEPWSTKIIMGGYPFGASRFSNISINEGAVQSVNKDNYDNDNTWIYVDLKGLPGNSGSGVLNTETGQIEGIFAGASVNPNNQAQTINRMIPVQYLWNLLLQSDKNVENTGVAYSSKIYSSSINCSADNEPKNTNKYHDNIVQKEKELEIGLYDNIKIVRGDLTTYTGDAIVNAANKYLAPGGGVCGAIYRGAGYKELDEVCRRKGEQKIGSATLTSGFNLPAKYIIHAVGPRYDYDRNPERLLADAYRNSLEVAKENNVKSIAFPSISTGIYNFPINLACPIALREIMNYAKDMKEIVIYCYEESTYYTYVDTFRRLRGI